MRILAFTLFILTCTATVAQNFLTSYGSINNDEALSIGMDESGDVYTAGYFNSSASFQGNSVLSNGLSDIFIAKTNEIGTPEWIFTGGSAGPDRGFDIAVAPDGSSCITGFLSNGASLGGTSYSTNSLSQDFYVLKLNPAGDVEWVRVFGGELGDTGYGIDIGPNGEVVVTGQFRGTIDFDGTQFTSTPLENGGLSYDTFILKLAANGDVIWAKHGQNNYESRGMDVKADAAGNVIVCGQFSDTLTFDQTHNNDVFNAAFLVQFDADGNEQWFRRFTSSQTIAYALTVNSDNDIYVTGDNIGPLYFFENEDDNAFFPVDYTYNLFVAKFNQSGALQWLTNNGSENSVSAKEIDLDANGEPYITGTFNCRFDEYSEEYGSGIFYSAGWRDIYISKFSASDGSRHWSRHMASNRDDYCSAIVLKAPDMPVIAGSFENRFVVTDADSFVNLVDNDTDWWNSDLCGDGSYGEIRFVQSEGNKDIFLSAPINLSREPLDYFNRGGNACDRPYLPPCVNQCADSLIHCGSTNVNFTDFIQNIIHPQYDFTWQSSTSVNPDNLDIPETGTYYWTYERLDGCESFSDSLHATINPKPLPLVSDNVVVNTNSPPHADPIELCFPDSALLMGSNFSETNNIWWSSNTAYAPTDADSAIYVYQSGAYSFHISNEFGCSRVNHVNVEVYEPLDSLDLQIVFPDYPEPVDTIFLCEDAYFAAELVTSDGSQVDLSNILENGNAAWSISPSSANITGESSPEDISVNVYYNGYYTLQFEIEGICNETSYSVERSVYVVEYPQPSLDIFIDGDGDICPGDTSLLVAYGDTLYSWSGPDFIEISNDSILAWQPGNYTIGSSITNSFGCTESDTYSFGLDYREAPEVAMFPQSGIVCPGDSVMLVTENGIDHIWVGPQGQVVGTGQSIWVDIPGFYHCVLTDMDSCVIESNFVEVKEYSSPYLVMSPSNDLCFSGSIEITAVTDPSATVIWGQPLNVAGSTVTVTEPGVYTASVTLCGITTTQSVTVYETEVNAFVNISVPPTVCNGDSVLLDGNPGMYEYEWLPGGETTEDLWVTEPGEYTLVTSDEQGCAGVSETISISGQPEVAIADLEYNTICAPDSILLSVTGDFETYTWSPTDEITSSIWVTEPGTYQVFATDANGCSATSEPEEIVPGTAPSAPAIPDELHCAGEDLSISATVNGDLIWVFPEGEQIANPLTIIDLESDTVLTYFVLGQNGCTSETDSLFVQVIDTNYQPEIYGDSIICANDTLEMFTDDLGNSTFSWTVNGELISSVTELSYSNFDGSESLAIQLTVNVANCAVGVENESVQVLPLPAQLEITGSPHICEGDSGLLFTQSPDTVQTIWLMYGEEYLGDSLLITSLPTDSTLILLTSFWNSCQNEPQAEWVYSEPYPEILSVNSNSPVCAGEVLELDATASPEADVTITSPWGPTFSDDMVLFPSDTSYTGEYLITAGTAFCSASTTTWLEINPLPAFNLVADSVYCTGNPAEFEIANYDLVFWQDSILSNVYSTWDEGEVKVEVINEFGCAKKDSVFVNFGDCDGVLSNVFTPNGDGVNDYFNFNPYGFDELRVIIYNRWGKVVCELIDINQWDGIHCKTGRPVSHGTYFYIVEYVTREFDNGTKSGYIQVFK